MNRIAFLALVLFTVGTACGHAHAFLDHAKPKVGSTITASPGSVTIWFTEDVKDAGSSIAVFDGTGKEVDRKDAQADPKNRSMMTVTLPSLPPGTYKVVWKATCKLGHHTTGSFTFTVTKSSQ